MSRADEIAESLDEGILQIDGFDECIIGHVTAAGQPPRLAYSEEAIIATLMERDGLDYEDAIEHFCFNIAGAYMGAGTPVFFTPYGDS